MTLLPCAHCGETGAVIRQINDKGVALCCQCCDASSDEGFNGESQFKLSCLRCGSQDKVSADWVEEYNGFGEGIGGAYVAFCQKCWNRGEATDNRYAEWQAEVK